MKRARATRVVVAAVGALAIGIMWPGEAGATSSLTRSSSFAYDAASGLITQEVVEPGTPALRLETDTAYDAFGNKASVTVSGVDIATRASSTTYDARGQFVVTNTNALGQSETWAFEARFGKATSQTGPNGLTTTWSYDTFGRKILEVRADGTRTAIAYLFCSGVNGGTATCISGASYLIKSTPYASDGATQNGPIGIVYFDALDREIGRDTQGFDTSTVRALRQYDSFGRVQQTSRPYFVASGTPQWTTYTFDTLGRILTAAFPDGSTTHQAYHGLTTTETNALSQTRTVTKNARGEVISVTDALSHTMTYAYDPVGNPVSTTDAVGNVVTATYDTRGRKISSTDPDLGTWTYSYDTLGELVSQTDAKSQTTTFNYDKLGRAVQRVETDMTAQWVYDTAAMGVGKLTSASITAGPGSGYARTYSYDSLGRPASAATTISGTTYTFTGAYDSNGRLSSVTYPSGFVAKYSYTALGYSNQLSDGTTSQVHWTLNTLDAEQHIMQATSGNGVITNNSFSLTTGRLLSVQAAPSGSSGTVQNLGFSYDALGNVLGRTDNVEAFSESFTYDALNRLNTSTVSTNISPAKSFAYDAIGNLVTKSDIGTYTYPVPGSPQPHAVTSISGSVISTTFTYDANGNQTAGLGRSIAWSSYNKPASITQGTTTISFLDDPNHQRFQQVTPNGTTYYFDSFGVHAEFVVSSSSSTWNEYLTVGSALVGVRFNNPGAETLSTRYFHTDHLGSIAVITDETGAVQERLSYDPWGKRRFANGADDPAGSITSQTTRGFTGQEELGITGLLHLNGRVYDTLVARMMSADPTVPDAMNPQAWNRYSYVGNDPLTFTDPTGFSWLSSFFHSVASFLQRNPIVAAVLEIVAAVVLAPLAAVIAGAIGLAGSAALAASAAIAAAGSAAIVTGLSGGNLSSILRASAIAGATALAFYAAGDITNQFPGANAGPAGEHGIPTPGSAAYVVNVATHAGVGCLSAIASGGKCGPAALAAATGSAAGPFLPHDLVGGTLARAAVGGAASVAGGGKFENGAITAAFGYLFNELGTLKQRAYEPTIYSDGTICNGGYTHACIGNSIQPSYLAETIAGLRGAGAFLRAISEWLTGSTSEIQPGGASQIDRATFRSEREAFWKNEAQENSGAYSSDNLARMENGRAPIGSDGYPMELHHVDGSPTGGIEPMTRTDHRLGDNFLRNHPWLDK